MKITPVQRKNILLFSFIFLLLVSVLSCIFSPKDNGEEDGFYDSRIFGFLAEPENSLDVLILGDSLAASTISPLEIWNTYGITSYNCGAPDQQLNYTEEYLHRFFEHQSPKIVLMEAHALYKDFSGEEIPAQKAEQLFPVFRYHNLWKTAASNRLLRHTAYTKLHPTKGFHPSLKIASTDKRKIGLDTRNKIVSHASEHNQEYFAQIVTYCHERGAQLILFSAPTLESWNLKRHNGMIQFAIESGVPYVDMNFLEEEVPINWEHDSYDAGDHLNNYGAEKVTGWWGKYLQETGLFADKRTDPAFSAWNASYLYYKENLQEIVRPFDMR